MLRTIAKILLSPFVVLYSVIIRTRNMFFDKGIFKTTKVDAKVISVGNLVVGGAGKTPAVILVTEELKKMGKKTGILSRGYRRTTKGYQFISDGNKFFKTVQEAGDEICLASSECMVPAAVAEKRVDGAKQFLKDAELDVIVLDDAYQHRWIHRDLNILVFDQKFLRVAGRMDQQLLPLGLMREPFTEAKRADLVIVNRKFSKKEELPKKILRYFEGKTIVHAYYKATGFYDVKDHKFYEMDEFKGQKSLVVCGIARPHSFLNVLKQNQIDLKNKLIFRDHKTYDMKEIQAIRKEFYDTNSYSVLTTQKDAVKLIDFSKEFDDIDIYYLKIEMIIEEKDLFLNKLNDTFN